MSVDKTKVIPNIGWKIAVLWNVLQSHNVQLLAISGKQENPRVYHTFEMAEHCLSPFSLDSI